MVIDFESNSLYSYAKEISLSTVIFGSSLNSDIDSFHPTDFYNCFIK